MHLGETGREQAPVMLMHTLASQPKRHEIDVICDNVSSNNKAKGDDDFLAEHRVVHIHFTPTYSLWLNQVKNWFSRIHSVRLGVLVVRKYDDT